MAQFGKAFDSNQCEQKISEEDLIRALRNLIADEFEAVNIYTSLADSTNNGEAAALLRDIADEEKVHAGEFMQLLFELDPDEESHYAKGMAEAMKVLGQIS
jgi:rubrerythrin